MIDSEAMIETPLGPRPLCSVQVGDLVFNDKGEPCKVINMEWGKPHPDHLNEYLAVECNGEFLVCTEDQIVGGKQARQWQRGDVMKRYKDTAVVSHAGRTMHRDRGDLQLADGSNYVANGFVVGTMFDEAVTMQGIPLVYDPTLGEKPAERRRRVVKRSV